MKQPIKKMQYLLFALLVLTVTSVQANSSIFDINFGNGSSIKAIINDLVGAWEYTVENAPPEYSEGIISISNENDAYAVQVQLSAGMLQGDNVSVDGNKIMFNLLIEGSSVSVVLTAEGDTISGESTSSDGVYSIAGQRIKPR